ncbi:protein-tyrosine phosphatase family protein [uncultured Jannaschia sp.]|uniref:phosphatase domain-containing protein n=1 Tax=uncultured Jannaschia sp. TaxID=293347 RepID=UPI00260F5ABE|nr:protein-tyrosine phosphatase family protein [uncultured Jannaschia sp.]
MTFAIASLEIGPGRIGLAPRPGRAGPVRDDLDRIAEWGAERVLTLTAGPEADLGAIRDGCDARGIGWNHVPIVDFCTPDRAASGHWATLEPGLTELLGRGGGLLIHCQAGRGRSGMIALRLMIRAGELPEAALARLRAIRPGAVETDAQYRWAVG